MRCWSSSAWTRISPMCSSWSKSRSLGPAERDPANRSVSCGEALARRDPRDPRDLVAREHDGDGASPLARDLAIGEQVLERAAAAEARRAHPVAVAPRADVEPV